MKLIYKIAMIGAMLASGIVTASAQYTGRSGYDNPTRNWNSNMRTGTAYYGEGYYGYGEGYYGDAYEMRGYNNYNVSRDTIWAAPQSDNYSPGDR